MTMGKMSAEVRAARYRLVSIRMFKGGEEVGVIFGLTFKEVEDGKDARVL